MPQNLVALMVFAGFLFVGFLLAVGHAGFAAKFADYFYFALLGVVFWSLTKK